MRVKWEVNDGYAGGSRSHYVDIPDDVVDEIVMEDFNEKVSFSWSRVK